MPASPSAFGIPFLLFDVYLVRSLQALPTSEVSLGRREHSIQESVEVELTRRATKTNLWLQIAMHKVLQVHDLQPFQDLGRNGSDLFFLESTSIGYDVLFQVS